MRCDLLVDLAVFVVRPQKGRALERSQVAMPWTRGRISGNGPVLCIDADILDEEVERVMRLRRGAGPGGRQQQGNHTGQCDGNPARRVCPLAYRAQTSWPLSLPMSPLQPRTFGKVASTKRPERVLQLASKSTVPPGRCSKRASRQLPA